MSRHEFIERFLTISYVYLQLRDQSSAEIPLPELEELIGAINMENDLMLYPDHVAYIQIR